jgi:hypothetical protein
VDPVFRRRDDDGAEPAAPRGHTSPVTRA